MISFSANMPNLYILCFMFVLFDFMSSMKFKLLGEGMLGLNEHKGKLDFPYSTLFDLFI